MIAQTLFELSQWWSHVWEREFHDYNESLVAFTFNQRMFAQFFHCQISTQFPWNFRSDFLVFHPFSCWSFQRKNHHLEAQSNCENFGDVFVNYVTVLRILKFLNVNDLRVLFQLSSLSNLNTTHSRIEIWYFPKFFFKEEQES